MCSGIVHSDGSALGPTAGVKWDSEARGKGTGIAGWCLDTRTGLARKAQESDRTTHAGPLVAVVPALRVPMARRRRIQRSPSGVANVVESSSRDGPRSSC